jgi:predicted ATPase
MLKGEDIARRQRLLESLSEFGAESSLFKKISVKSLGKRPSDPFQILVSLLGPAANLLDVGYGVSQALPIVVQSILAEQQPGPFKLLLQQPEVHLHPRGQAALGSFFSRLVANGKMEFVIETHSDHLVDRVRQEVARGTISNQKVQILFFDRKGTETTVHEIHLDKRGNVLKAPGSYRRFFLEEETNLLTRAAGR